MMTIHRKNLRAFFAGLLLFFIAAAAACEAEKMVDPKGSLESVAAEYWNQRLMKKDYKATYPMEMEKEGLPYEAYLKRVENAGEIGYLSIKIEDVKVDQDKGDLTVKVMCNIAPVPKPVPLTIKDHWVVHKNQWKHLLPKN